MSDAIRVLLVDDHAVVRQGLRAFLRLLVELKAQVATVEVPRIIDLDHKRDLEAAERWLAAGAEP